MTEEGVHEALDRAGEVTEPDSLVDDETFDLVERWQMGCVGGVGSKRSTGSHDVDRRLLVFHRADLHW